MDLRKIKKLIELVEESGISELEVRAGDESVRIARPPNGGAATAAPIPVPAAAPVSPPPPVEGVESSPDVEAFRAPMAGTFYRASEPGAEPFVREGSRVEVGDVLCIIESMKMMNEVKAERAGVVHRVVSGNAEPVSTGQVLFELR